MRNPLKIGVYLSIKTQENLNMLSEVTGAFEADSIHIDEEYVAYLDFEGSVEDMVHVRKLSDFQDEYPTLNFRLTKFKVWYRKVKNGKSS